MNPAQAIEWLKGGELLSRLELSVCVGDGLLLEFGVFKGESFTDFCIMFAPRKMYGFDWFYGLPEAWGAAQKGEFSTNGVLPDVPSNGELVVGLVEETLDKFLAEHPEPAAFVHFDMDLYAPTAFVLNRLRFRPGSILLFDEIIGNVRNDNNEGRALAEFGATRVERIGQIGGESVAYVVKNAHP